jgi:hypothetical protein
MDDILCYSVEHVRAQVRSAQDAGAQESRGFFEVRFYTEGGRPSRERSGSIETFYYYPSGGTIRDREMNIVFYEPKLDKYHTSSREA